MTNIMMLLGPYPFMLNTAAYDGLKRSASYRWKKQPRIGRKPANQFLGADLQTVQMSGTILPHFAGGLHQLDLMRATAGAANPLLLVDGRGFVWGDWVIKQVSENQTVFHANGAPHKIMFSLSLEEYGPDQAGMSALSLGVSAVSTLARLL